MPKPTPRILYTSKDVRAAIVSLFKDPNARRVAISAFVGDGAGAYLPSPNGLRLICSPTPGATNPNALRALMKAGASVEFVKSLHMKVYWAEGRGAVITSANLSTNAMGKGGLLEAGVFLDDATLDIDKLISQLDPILATGAALKKLDRQNNHFHKRNGWGASKQQAPSYCEWFDRPSPEPWAVSFYKQTSDELSVEAMDKIQKAYNRTPFNYLWSKTSWKENTWILLVHITPNAAQVEEPAWLYADMVVAVPETDQNSDPRYPHEIIQIHEDKHYPPPPFRLNPKFRAALGKLYQGRQLVESDSPHVLTEAELQSLRDTY